MSRSVTAYLGEGTVAERLGELQDRFPDVEIGSYPFYREKRYGTSLVLRATDGTRLEEAADAVFALVAELGGDPEPGESA